MKMHSSTAMKRGVAVVLVALLTACARDSAEDGVTQRQDTQVDRLEQRVADHETTLAAREARIAQLEQELADAEAALAEARAAAAAAEARAAALAEALRDVEARAMQEAREAEIRVAEARAASEASVNRVRQLAEQNAVLARELEEARRQVDMLPNLAPAGAIVRADQATTTEVMAAEVELEDLADDTPILKRVYFATNRVRLSRTFGDYLKPFLGFAVALVLTALLTRAIRRYIKEEHQSRLGLVVRVVGGLAIVVLGGLGLQKSLLMRQDDAILKVQFGNEIREADAYGTPYERGWVSVSIPPKRRAGELNRPSLIRLEFVVDPTKHFQLAAVTPSDDETFYAELSETLARDPEKQAFVFVHGFHNTFQDAAFRTAQIAHDMQFPGAPVFFSWPSQGAVLDYLTDAANVETSVLHLRQFLEELHRESGATRIHLIAHSMGTRALSQAVEKLSADGLPDNAFGQLVFAAPDIKRDLLAQKIEALDRITDGVTLYASAHDSALLLSRALQGGDEENYQRAGETHPRPMVAPPMQTVDVSQATKGHSYVANSRLMLRDLAILFREARILEPSADNYVPTGIDAGYWLLEPE